MLVKRRWTVILVFLGLVTLVAIKTLTQTPVYRATAKLLIERTNPGVLSVQEIITYDTVGQEFHKTQYQILESRSLAREVIKRLNLTKDVFMNSADKKSGEGGSSSPLVATKRNEAGLINNFLRNLKIEPVRESRIVKIIFQATDPQVAAQTANTIAQAYIEWNLGLRLKSHQNAAVFLEDQVREVKRKLEVSETALQKYREKYGIAALSIGQGTKETHGAQDMSRQKLAQVNAQLIEITNKRIEAEMNYKKARELIQNPEKAESIPEVVNNPIIIAIKTQEVQLLREKSEMGGKFGPKHLTMIALTQEIENIRKRMIQEIENIVESLKSKYEIYVSQEKTLQTVLGTSQTDTINRDKIAIQYQALQQDVESTRNLYDMLLKRLKEAQVSEENRLVNIHIVDPAEVPETPFKPNIASNLLWACLMGLILGGGAFFLEQMDNTIKTPQDLVKYLRIPYLGPVPPLKLSNGKVSKPELITLHDPKAPGTEAYRGLRTGILFSNPGHSPRTVLLTSAVPLEGKTITSANLAIIMAQSGQRVLILDADMRKPRLHSLFSCAREPGLTNILVGKEKWRDVKIATPVDGLEIIPSGPLPPNPAELIGSDTMRSLLAELVLSYELVMIDTPPMASVTDSALLARFVDGVILVVQVGGPSREIIVDSLRSLKDIQAHLLGGILNKFSYSKGKYYQYYAHKERRDN